MAGLLVKAGRAALIPALAALLGGCAAPRGTGDLGVVIERASGSVQVVDNTRAESLGRVEGLGDLSHASVVFSRDARYAYVFGRDGAISKVDLLRRRLERRVVQAGNSIGGAISSDGRVLAAQNYQPGGVRLFDAVTLAPLASVPAAPGADGKPSRVVGLADLPGRRFVYALFDADEIDVLDAADPAQPKLTRYRDAGKRPYDGLASMDGRYFLAGLYGEDGLSLLDTWRPEQGVRRILAGYGRGQQPLPVYKMPHLRGWALAGDYAFLPAIGRHEVLLADNRSWAQQAAVPVLGQPVFVMAEPSGRRVWVNFAFPDNNKVQVIDVPTRSVIATLKPGKAILHMEFTPRGDAVWLSSRDDDKLVVVDTASLKVLRELPARSPSGIFFSWRASRIGM
ncbi:cytochrome D1 domain-containing protein [Chromobacterium haemolyticum]|uniref:cytochrome D1 domain-containing protein n=1 Tax=Chromobacterium haemolyticum TaxID=394935 RepID=UPI0009D93317|nr:cytochrome D1 domain-containing protein [Chromobacterium haemolyticum]OQS33897.1 protein nirF [Chromobacterium haemolyticum]